MNEVNFLEMAMMSGRLKKAFEKSVARDPNHLAGLIGLARYYTNAPEIAGGSLAKAAERLQPENPGIQYACGFQLAKLGRKDEARARFEAALKLNPGHEPSKKALAELDAPTGK